MTNSFPRPKCPTCFEREADNFNPPYLDFLTSYFIIFTCANYVLKAKATTTVHASHDKEISFDLYRVRKQTTEKRSYTVITTE